MAMRFIAGVCWLPVLKPFIVRTLVQGYGLEME